jgi:hypothetical protein
MSLRILASGNTVTCPVGETVLFESTGYLNDRFMRNQLWKVIGNLSEFGNLNM